MKVAEFEKMHIEKKDIQFPNHIMIAVLKNGKKDMTMETD